MLIFYRWIIVHRRRLNFFYTATWRLDSLAFVKLEQLRLWTLNANRHIVKSSVKKFTVYLTDILNK